MKKIYQRPFASIILLNLAQDIQEDGSVISDQGGEAGAKDASMYFDEEDTQDAAGWKDD
jgi:hypothetical protein